MEAVPEFRGRPLTPLVWPPSPGPIPGESLMSLLARTAAGNEYRNLTRVIRLADIATGTPESMPTAHGYAADRIATVLNVSLDDVRCRLLDSARPDDEASYLDFNGVPIRALYRERLRRRVSPRALQISPHCRSAHELRPFSFCAETWEHLIDTCPVCLGRLGWKMTAGVEFCERCLDEEGEPVTDLRDFPQALVEVEDERALRFVTDLVHHDPSVRERAVRAAGPLAASGPGGLFEGAVAFAWLQVPRPGKGGGRRMRTLADFGQITPQLLSSAGRILLDWPRSFHALADTAREGAAARAGHYGVAKELGHLSKLAHDPYLPDELREAIGTAIGENLSQSARRTTLSRRREIRHRDDLMTTAEVAERLGVHRAAARRLRDAHDLTVVKVEGASKAPTLFLRDEIEALAEVRKDLVGRTATANRLGIPPFEVDRLGHLGALRIAAGPAVRLLDRHGYVRRGSLDELCARLIEVARRGLYDAPDRPVRLSTALLRSGCGEKPYAETIVAVAKGELAVTLDEEMSGGMMSRLLVSPSRISAFLAEPRRPSDGSLQSLTYPAAAMRLGTSQVVVSALVAEGILARSGDGPRTLSIVELDRFSAAYALTPEIARRLRIRNRDVRSRMASFGIEPVASLLPGKGWIWDRGALGVSLLPRTCGSADPSSAQRP